MSDAGVIAGLSIMTVMIILAGIVTLLAYRAAKKQHKK